MDSNQWSHPCYLSNIENWVYGNEFPVPIEIPVKAAVICLSLVLQVLGWVVICIFVLIYIHIQILVHTAVYFCRWVSHSSLEKKQNLFWFVRFTIFSCFLFYFSAFCPVPFNISFSAFIMLIISFLHVLLLVYDFHSSHSLSGFECTWYSLRSLCHVYRVLTLNRVM